MNKHSSKSETTKHTEKKTKSIFNPLRHLTLPRVIVFLFFLILAVIGFFVFLVIRDIPTTATIGRNSFPQSSKIYDRDGKLLYTIYASRNQTFVPIDKLPKNLKNATIAIEDKDFYNHGAIDIRGITRAFYFTFFKKQIQGGSTITQQLVKNSILTQERTFTRKIREVMLSFIVEALYSKDKILEMYLNNVAYGGTAWGAEAASQVYFNKSVSSVNLSEAAFLAGLPEAPSLYSPFGAHPEEAKIRQKEVLRKMREQGYISDKQEKEAASYPLTFSKFADKISAPHFVFYVKDLLVQKYGQKAVEQGGLNVITSLDSNLQSYAQNVVATEVAKLKDYNVSNGAALITNPKTGEILVMVGSRDYFDTEHDGNVNVTIAYRQPGSSIKPINYATGLAKGYTAATPFVDKKVCYPSGPTSYCPVNYDGKFHGVTQMRIALANSFNIPAVKMLKLNGLDSFIATASAMGITTFDSPDRYGLALTLGGGEITMVDMAEAFGVFANSGYKIPLHPILKVTDSHGKVLEEYKPSDSPIFGKKVMNEGIAFIISQILSDNGARSFEFGTNSPLKVGNYQVSVKTGTTNDFRDNWTIGYTPSYVTAVWVGNNNNTPMNGLVSGITGAAPIWHDLMMYILKDKKQEIPIKPDNVIGKIICADSGLLPLPEGNPDRCPTRFEYFIKGTEPNRVENGKEKVFIDKATQNIAEPGKTDNIEERNEKIVTDPLGDKYCVTCPQPTPTPKP